MGLKSDLDPAEASRRLGDLLRAHHYTDGLELLPHGAATNNTDDAASALTSHDPNFEALYALEQGPTLCPAGPNADGDRLARALGVDPALLAHVRGADSGQDQEAGAMNTVLWPTTWGYYLEQMVGGALAASATLVPLARDHFARHVRARGHFPILRVGAQPYGVLPVMGSAGWKALAGSALEGPLMGLLGRMRTTWENSVQNVPQLHGAADPEQALVAILGMSPASASYVARNLIGPEYNLTAFRFLRRDLGQAWWSALAVRSLAQVGDLSTALVGTRLANATFVNFHRLLTDVLVAPAPLDGQPAPDYVAKLQALSWQALRDLPMPPQPVPLFLLLLRHAVLRQYVDTAGDLLGNSGAVQPSERIEAELLGLSAAAARPTPWDILQRNYADKGPVGAYLDTVKTGPDVAEFAAFWAAFAKLATLPAAALDAAARESMDLAAFRLDAWLTSMAHSRLDQMRAATSSPGVILGAFGWLEEVRPQPGADSAGYVHAPSLAQGVTAAVLRSAYLSHAGDSQSPMRIDLTSDRVRLALHLLDGVREGQPLGALLGYRLERTLHDAGLSPLIAGLRTIAAVDNPDPPPGTQEAVAANNVVDGLALLRKAFVGGVLGTGPGLPTDVNARHSLSDALTVLNDALDAVADVTLAESVHQLTKGNTLRAGATLDAVARGDVRPPEIEVVQTPRAGSAFTHRLFAAASGAAPAGWSATPRANAEPRLNGWAGLLFGPPTRVRARARFTDAMGAEVGRAEIGLDALAVAPLDILATADQGLGGELGERLRSAAAAARPAGVAMDSAVSLLDGRDTAWTADIVDVSEFVELAQAVSKLVSGARALTPQDLSPPGTGGGAVDTGELEARADAAETALRAVFTRVQGASVGDADLLAAAALGARGAIPSANPVRRSAQPPAVAGDLAKRVATLDGLAAGFTRIGAAPNALRDHDIARLKAVFGDAFTVLPALDAATTAQWTHLWSGSADLQGHDPLAATTWFQRMARVRPGAGRLNEALLHAESLAEASLLKLEVAQLPAVPGDRWVGSTGAAPASGRLSLVAFAPEPVAPGDAVAGLILDEWVEVIPSPQQITGLAFQHDDPTARAPQTVLLGVPADDFPDWTLRSVEATILEALDLAKLRAVDPDALSALGHYLPALYFAYNAGGPSVETVSTDFNLVRADMTVRNA